MYYLTSSGSSLACHRLVVLLFLILDEMHNDDGFSATYVLVLPYVTCLSEYLPKMVSILNFGRNACLKIARVATCDQQLTNMTRKKSFFQSTIVAVGRVTHP